MTEKKKRVRPKKVKEEPKSASNCLNELVEFIQGGPNPLVADEGASKQIRRINPVSTEVLIERFNAEHPEQHASVREVKLPENWNTMGKLDKLKFLTANKK